MRNKLQHLQHHASEILEKLKAEENSSNSTKQSASAEAKIAAQENIQQRILAAQSALEKIAEHLNSGGEPTVNEYQVRLN